MIIMALINCSECSKEVSDKASICPNCGNPINDIIGVNKEKGSSWGCMKTFFFLLVLFGIGVPVVNWLTSDGKVESSTVNHSELLAFIYAEDCVKSRLKSPSTAKFPNARERKSSTTYKGNGSYEINSWVDSQNGFGATIRSNFTCVVKFDGTKVRCESVLVY